MQAFGDITDHLLFMNRLSLWNVYSHSAKNGVISKSQLRVGFAHGATKACIFNNDSSSLIHQHTWNRYCVALNFSFGEC